MSILVLHLQQRGVRGWNEVEGEDEYVLTFDNLSGLRLTLTVCRFLPIDCGHAPIFCIHSPHD